MGTASLHCLSEPIIQSHFQMNPGSAMSLAAVSLTSVLPHTPHPTSCSTRIQLLVIPSTAPLPVDLALFLSTKTPSYIRLTCLEQVSPSPQCSCSSYASSEYLCPPCYLSHPTGRTSFSPHACEPASYWREGTMFPHVTPRLLTHMAQKSLLAGCVPGWMREQTTRLELVGVLVASFYLNV